MIQDIEPNSPAEKGGLKPGDKLLAIDDENVEESSYMEVVNTLRNALNSNQSDIKMIAMNAIEYNILKSKNENRLKTSNFNLNIYQKIIKSERKYLNLGTDNRNSFDGDSLSDYENYKVGNANKNGIISSNSKSFEPNFDLVNSTYEFSPSNGEDKQTKEEFNPFEDVPNDIFKPFMNYATIPPPDNFKASHESNVFAPKQMQRVTNDQFSSSNESDDSDNYEHLVNQSSKSNVQNFVNDFQSESNFDFENFSNNNNNQVKNSNVLSKKQVEKYKIENLSNSDMSESPINEDFNDYFK